jgi:sulfate adenylyltransferase subunit 2
MAMPRSDYLLSQLDVPQAESIHVMREVAAGSERPVLLFSVGRNSIVMLAPAERAFWPGPCPVSDHASGHGP